MEKNRAKNYLRHGDVSLAAFRFVIAKIKLLKHIFGGP